MYILNCRNELTATVTREKNYERSIEAKHKREFL